MRCKTLTAIYKNEINTLKKLYEIDFLIHKSVRIHIEQFTVRKIEIDFTSEQLVDDLIAVLTKVERLLMLFDGYFIDDNSPAPSGGFGNPFNDPNWEQHITSFFGKREDVGIPGKDTTNHNGLDIAYPYGTPILAVEAGTVIKAGYHVSYGNYLVINHGGGYCTLYAHCSQLLAQVGDTVNKYDTIAKVGATGDVTGNHLHICVIIDGVYVNPKGYLH